MANKGEVVVKVVKTGGIWAIGWFFTLGVMYGLMEDPANALESASWQTLILGTVVTYIAWPLILGTLVGGLLKTVTATLS